MFDHGPISVTRYGGSNFRITFKGVMSNHLFRGNAAPYCTLSWTYLMLVKCFRVLSTPYPEMFLIYKVIKMKMSFIYILDYE